MRGLADKVLLISIGLILTSCNFAGGLGSGNAEEFPSAEIIATPIQLGSQFTPSAAPPTATELPKFTLTPPTLSPELSELEVRRLMQDDVGCKLPCFLGVVPGETSLEELANIFHHFGWTYYDYQRTVYDIDHLGDDKVPPDTWFDIQNGTVKNIKIYPDPSNEFDWSLYSPANILKRFGSPSFVTFGLLVIHEPTPDSWMGWYRMTFYYDDLDLIIQYSNPQIGLNSLITICPNIDKFFYTRIWLGKDPAYAPPITADGPLSEATSFTSLESFKDYLLLGPGACFDLIASGIPIY